MDLDGKKYFEKNEKGEIMLEGMLVMIITMQFCIGTKQKNCNK